MRFAVLAFVLGCGGSKPDCGAYAAKYADNIGADKSRVTTVMTAERDACEAGQVDAKQIECVMHASGSDAVRACVHTPK